MWYYLGTTTDRNYQLLELPLNNVGNSEVFDRNYHCFLAAHRHLLVANFNCYGPSDTHYIATSPKPHSNPHPNPYPSPYLTHTLAHP